MRLHRFFIREQIQGKNTLVVTNVETLHQWKKVFRLGAGDTVVLFDGFGREYACEITLLSKERAELLIKESCRVHTFSREIWLCAAIIKKDNFEWIVEKATELGVSNIVPILADRSEKKDLNSTRLLKIATEASEQSGRGSVPYIYEAQSLFDATTLLSGVGKIVFEPVGGALVPTDFLDKRPVALFVGPEGGWTDEELTFFGHEQIEKKTLGDQILRAETAAIAVTTLFTLR